MFGTYDSLVLKLNFRMQTGLVFCVYCLLLKLSNIPLYCIASFLISCIDSLTLHRFLNRSYPFKRLSLLPLKFDKNWEESL